MKRFYYLFFAVLMFAFLTPVYAKNELRIEKINEVSITNGGFKMAPFVDTFKTSDGGYVVAQEQRIIYLTKDGILKWDFEFEHKPDSYDMLVDGNYVYLTYNLEECSNVNFPGESIDGSSAAAGSEKVGRPEPRSGDAPEVPIDDGKGKPEPRSGDAPEVPIDDGKGKPEPISEDGNQNYHTIKLNLSNGNIVKESTDFGGSSIRKIGNNYVIAAGTYILTMDSNLNIVKEINTRSCVYNLAVYNNQISAINASRNITIYDSSLNQLSTKTFPEFEWGFGLRDARSFLTDGENHYLVNFYVFKINGAGNTSTLFDYVDTDLEYMGRITGEKLNNYYLLGGFNDRFDGTDWVDRKAFVELYDNDFNYVQSVELNEEEDWVYVKDITKTDTGFVVKWISPTDNMLHVSEYALKYNITTEVQGKGSIEIIGSAFAGEPVTFKVVPEPGYVVLRVTVTDVNGNTVVYEGVDSDYLFTMPNSDAKVSVQFLKNPLTMPGVWYSVALLVAVLIITIIVKRKRTVNQ